MSVDNSLLLKKQDHISTSLNQQREKKARLDSLITQVEERSQTQWIFQMKYGEEYDRALAVYDRTEGLARTFLGESDFESLSKMKEVFTTANESLHACAQLLGASIKQARTVLEEFVDADGNLSLFDTRLDKFAHILYCLHASEAIFDATATADVAAAAAALARVRENVAGNNEAFGASIAMDKESFTALFAAADKDFLVVRAAIKEAGASVRAAEKSFQVRAEEDVALYAETASEDEVDEIATVQGEIETLANMPVSEKAAAIAHIQRFTAVHA